MSGGSEDTQPQTPNPQPPAPVPLTFVRHVMQGQAHRKGLLALPKPSRCRGENNSHKTSEIKLAGRGNFFVNSREGTCGRSTAETSDTLRCAAESVTCNEAACGRVGGGPGASTEILLKATIARFYFLVCEHASAESYFAPRVGPPWPWLFFRPPSLGTSISLGSQGADIPAQPPT